MEEIVFKSKLRITTLENNGAVIKDRLVDAYSEYLNGPKEKHDGPIRIEVTLQSSKDVDDFKNYLDQLKGDLPIKESAGRGRPSTTSNNNELKSPREDILVEVEEMVKKGENQTSIIKYLRELGFVFLVTEDLLHYFPDFPFEKKDIGKPGINNQYPESYTWLTRCIKRAKDPKLDKYDPMIIFGFSLLGEPSRKVIPYLYKDRKKPLRIPFKDNEIKKEIEFTKFPKYMLEEERLKFSTEQRQLLTNSEKKPSKFFLRWAGEVIFPKDVYEKLKDRVPNLLPVK